LISAATALASGNAALSSAATAQASGNAAQFTANTALVSGNAALSRAGGTMTGQIVFAAGQQITTSVNLSGGVSGAVPYQSAPGTTAFLSPGTSGQLLTTQGADQAPAWISFSPSTTLGAVGTYAFCKNSNAVSAGDLVSFSLLSYSGTNNLTGASVAAGTWRAMGSAGGNFATLYLRVS
jgi:hypothetical protein